MPNVVYHCRGCDMDIDADDPVVLLEREVGIRTQGSIDINASRRDSQVSHRGHEGIWTVQGYRVVREGPLRSIVP